MPPPVIFLCFANPREEGVANLRNLALEAAGIRAILESTEGRGLCEVVFEPNATVPRILDLFTDARYRNRIAIFHYGGHAGSAELLLENKAGEGARANAEGLAYFLGQQQGIQLVFLNGCSTVLQVEGLISAGVASVIATSQAIDDAVATDFAVRFYTSLVGGASLRTAYNEAVAEARINRGGSTRDLYPAAIDGKPVPQELTAVWPWSLNPAAAPDQVMGWNLPDAVGDPLYGLPELPKMDLPEAPFRNINWFRREDAPIFFGRGVEIRELYQKITASDGNPIILYYGQSGVGKSSLLAAGLLPRLDQVQQVVYVRRTETLGLFGTLLAALQAQVAHLGVAEAGHDAATLWHAIEAQAKTPLTVILDQVEEAYTRPRADEPDEVETLVESLAAIFRERATRPQGRIVLSFRKEWLAELVKLLQSRQALPSSVFLERLNRSGVIEAITGPARTERLRNQYNLSVEDGLADQIATDLLEDASSAVAPILQILLSKMWLRAKTASNSKPQFTVALYDELKRKGLLLEDFLREQMQALDAAQHALVASGLALDLLAFHTTPLGTAEERKYTNVRETYAQREAELPALLQACSDLYLLVDPSADTPGAERATRLAHDTLAPLVRREYEHSDAPGQRARRIVENRGVEWRDGKPGATLDDDDLALVEAGRDGMRALTDFEKRMLEASAAERAAHLAEQQRLVKEREHAVNEQKLAEQRALEKAQQLAESERRRASIARMGVIVATSLLAIAVVTAVFAIVQWNEAGKQTTEARKQTIVAETQTHVAQALGLQGDARSLAYAAQAVNEIDPESGLLYVQQSLALTTTREAEEALSQALYSSRVIARLVETGTLPVALTYRPDGSNLVIVRNPVETVGAVSARPRLELDALDGTATTQLTLSAPSDGTIAAISAATLSYDGNVLYAVQGDAALRGWNLHDGSLAWDGAHADGMRPFAIAVTDNGEFVAVAGTDDSGRGNGVVSVYAVGSDDALWQRANLGDLLTEVEALDVSESMTSTEPLLPADIAINLVDDQQPDHTVTDIAFSPDGRTLAAASRDGRVYLLDARIGARTALLTAHKDRVFAVAFAPDGQTLASGSADKTVLLWDLGQSPITVTRSFVEPTDSVTDLAFSPGGYCIAASAADGRTRVWEVKTGRVFANLGSNVRLDKSVAFRPLVEADAPISPAAPCGADELATANTAGAILRWNLGATGQPLTIAGYAAPVESVAYALNGDAIVASDDNGAVKLWDSQSGALIHEFVGHSKRVNAVAVSPDGTTLATAGWDYVVGVWDLQSGKKLAWRTDPDGHRDRVESVAFARNRRWLASGSSDGTAILYETTDYMPIRPVRHGAPVYSVAFSPDSQLLATAGGSAERYVAADGAVKVWRVDDVEAELPWLTLETGWLPYAVAFSSTGTQVAAADWGGFVTLWDLASPNQPRLRIAAHTNRAYGLAFAPLQMGLASSGADGTLRLWQPPATTPTLTRFGPEMNGLAFHPTLPLVAAGGEDGTLRIYTLELGALRSYVPGRVTRGLSTQECGQYSMAPGCQGQAAASTVAPP